MGCGVLYHFNGEKTHLNYSTLLVPCLPFRPRNINQNKMCCANRIVQGNRLLSELYRLPSESKIYFSISQLEKVYLKTWNESRTTKREHNQKESIETFFKLGNYDFLQISHQTFQPWAPGRSSKRIAAQGSRTAFGLFWNRRIDGSSSSMRKFPLRLMCIGELAVLTLATDNTGL
jgi:hypothetical protein